MNHRALIILACVLAYSLPAVAQLTDPERLPPSGNLSTSLKSGAASAQVPQPFGGEDISGEQLAPITGSVSRTSRDNWTMRVFNNTKDLYSVDLDVVQVNMQGSTVKTDSYSYRLHAGESREETISVVIGARDAALNLLHWRNLSEEERKRDAEEKDNG